MKSSRLYFQLSAMLALTAGLAACGGYSTVDLGGNVSGLVTDGLVLTDGSTDVAVAKNSTSYRFPSKIDAHGTYAVTVQTQPQHYTCQVYNTPGRASGLPVTYVDVICSLNLHNVVVTINNLKTAGLQLTNGADTLAPPANTATATETVTFTTKVAEESAYGVAVLTQPTGQTCTVQNGTAYMGTADASVTVNCVDNP